MLCLLSPAKTFASLSQGFSVSPTKPALNSQKNQLLTLLQQKNTTDLAKLMHLSPKLAELNHNRYQNWEKAEKTPALAYYMGDVYKSLKQTPLTVENWQNANQFIGILSGLYGFLRPTDAIKPHRLEMGTKLIHKNGKNLYDFWKSDITEQINHQLQKTNAKYVLNVASVEYFKSVQPKNLIKPVINIKFLQKTEKGYKNIAIYAKKARGLMARFVLDYKITQKEALLDFNTDNYTFFPEKSDENTLTFVRKR